MAVEARVRDPERRPPEALDGLVAELGGMLDDVGTEPSARPRHAAADGGTAGRDSDGNGLERYLHRRR